MAGSRHERGHGGRVLFDYGGVLTIPVRHSIAAWLADDRIDPGSFSRTLRAWLSRDAEDGTPIPVEVMRRLACEADIVPVVLNGRGEALDVGRTQRLATPAQRDALLEGLRPHVEAAGITTAGLAALLPLPDGAPDISIARETLAFGMGPAPLSAWYARPASGRSGLLLGIATVPRKQLARSCDRLCGIIDRFT